MPIKTQTRLNKFVVSLSGHSTAAFLEARELSVTLREMGGLQAGSTERWVEAEEERLHGFASCVLSQVAVMEILFPMVGLLPLVALADRAWLAKLLLRSRIISGDLRVPQQRPTWVMVSLLRPCFPPLPPTFLGAPDASHCAVTAVLLHAAGTVEGKQHLFSSPCFLLG